MSAALPPVEVATEAGVARVVFRVDASRPGADADAVSLASEVIEEATLSDEARAVLLIITEPERVPRGAAGPIAAIPQPVVAALAGQVSDHVLEAALAADIRLCDQGARFSLTQLRRGLLPSEGGTQRLPRIVGPGLASDMILTGRELTACEALAAGLVTEIVQSAQLEDRAHAIAAAIAGRGRLAARYAKEAVRRGADMPLSDAMRLEADLSILLHTDPERAEGIAAFRERRPPRFPAREA